jgi:ribose transport system ATP-binding protein
LGEILSTCDRIVVMRDGGVVDVRPARDFSRDSLVTAMGSVVQQQSAATHSDHRSTRSSSVPRIQAQMPTQHDGSSLKAYAGQIIGLAGLEGHGQRRMIELLFAASGRRDRNAVAVHGPVSLVAGDRQNDGLFPLWSIAGNITIGSVRERLRGFLIDHDAEVDMARKWQKRINIRTSDMNNSILSLSGGNQQKALFARALGSRSDTVLMDDPMRGVDVGTKQEVYAMIREEATAGRTFIWYTTEFDELRNCDHVYVFRDQRIVADLARHELSEERVLQSSFAGAA